MEPTNFNSETDNSPASVGLKKTLHGNVFQLKLLMLFLIRGIAAGYQFQLGTEMPEVGGKFEDLIFKFKDETTSNEKQIKSYQFLQAKHTQNEEQEKITATEILNDNEGDFSLPKYFRSYFRDIIQGPKGCLVENVHDCIICTNIGFENEDDLREGGIELIRLDNVDKILSFDNEVSARYKLKKTAQLCQKFAGWSEIHFLAKTLLDYVTQNKKLTLKKDVFKSYHLVLVKEKVIDLEQTEQPTFGLNKDFLDGTNLTGNVKEFRQILFDLTFEQEKKKESKDSAEVPESVFQKFWSKKSFKLSKDFGKKDDQKKGLGGSEMHLLAQTLLDYATQNKKLTLKCVIFKSYHLALVKEKVINLERQPVTNEKKEKSEGSTLLYYGKLNKDFLDGTHLRENVKEFRKILSDFTFEKMKKETKDSAEVRESVFKTFWRDKSFEMSKSFGTKDDQSRDETKESLDCAIRAEDITSFLDKLVFAVHTPNEVELDTSLKEEVGKYYELHENDFQSDFILRNMLDWFKKKESTFMTSEEGTNIFKEGEKKMKSLRMTAISIEYQKELKEMLEFNNKAIEEMKKKLMQLLTSPVNRIGRIATTLPKCTAVKVIGALEKFKSEEPITNNQIPKEYFECKDSYLVMSSSRLKNVPPKFESNNSHNLLVVVYEDGPSTETNEFCQKLVNEMPKKRVIIISQDKGEVEDELNFSDLSEKSQRVLLEKKIEFQGSSLSVGDLIKRRDTTLDGLIKNGDAGKILDFNSIEELIKGEQIEILSGSSARFEENLYIERQLEFPLDLANFNHFYDQLAKNMKCEKEKLQKECENIKYTTDELKNTFKVDSQGNIEWLKEDDQEKEKIWKEMKKLVNENSTNSPSSNDDPKKELITNENRKGKVFILDGIAGTGKSTILSNYYEKIIQKNPDTWVIRIDLLDYPNELKKFSPVNQQSAIEFFVDIFAKNSPFARSLLTHRFQTDGRIVVMLDGFDEIGDELREKVFQLITAIKLTNVDALYLTTRSHLKEKLQDKLFQFSYTLKKFSEEDQVDCLSKYWTSKLKMQNKVKEKSIQSFGERLVTRLSTTLKDKEKDFIGIPLQCRMLAEIYETQLEDTIQKESIDSLNETISITDLDLTSLYSLFMEKKFDIYVSQKLKTAELKSTIENGLEKYLSTSSKVPP